MSGHTLKVFFAPAITNTPATFTSDWQSIDQETGFAIQADYGIITGTIAVHGRVASMEPVTITEIAFDALAGVAGSQLINVADSYFQEFRVVYTHASGTETLRVGAHAKGA